MSLAADLGAVEPLLDAATLLRQLVLVPTFQKAGQNTYIAVPPGRARMNGYPDDIKAWTEMEQTGGGWVARLDDLEDDFVTVFQFPDRGAAISYVAAERNRGPYQYFEIFEFKRRLAQVTPLPAFEVTAADEPDVAPAAMSTEPSRPAKGKLWWVGALVVGTVAWFAIRRMT